MANPGARRSLPSLLAPRVAGTLDHLEVSAAPDEVSWESCEARGDLAGAFESTTMRGADLSEAELAAAHLFDCDLSGAELSKIRMAGARLHGCTIDEIMGAGYLRVVVIDATQIVPLALNVFAALGITIDDERERPP